MNGWGRQETAAGLRAWAVGSLAMSAAVELIIRCFGGRFALPGSPWIRGEPGGRVCVDVEVLRARSGVSSGGERRVLDVVGALLDETPIVIVDVVAGLDRANLHLVLAALAHAGGSHEHADLVVGPDGFARLSRPGPLVAWPTAGEPGSSPPDPHTCCQQPRTGRSVWEEEER